ADPNGGRLRIHVAVALEDDSLIHREGERRHVGFHAGTPAELDGVTSLDLPGDLAPDDDRAATDVRVDLRLLADDQEIVGDDRALAVTRYFARILLFFASCVTSARPSASSSGGIYMPKRPRSPFFSPYQPLTGFFGDRPHASTVPSAAGFCSSALPRGIQSPCFSSIACRSSMALR